MSSSFKLSGLICPLICVGVILFVFKSALGFDFIWWDDEHFIWNNASIQSFDPKNIFAWFTRTYVNSYVPIPMFVYAVQYAIAGNDPAVFHALSIGLHAVNTVLVFFLFRHFLGDSLKALAGALLFGIHPLQVETVAWVSMQRNLLYAGFFLGGFLLYIRDEEAGRKSPISYLFFMLALFSRVTGVVIPLVLSAYHFCYTKSNVKMSRSAGVFLPITVLFVGVATLLQYPGIVKNLSLEEFYPFFIEQCGALLIYFKLFFYPVGLSLFEYKSIAVHSPLWAQFLTLAGVAGTAAVFIYLCKRHKAAAFWVAWVFLFLLPVTSLFRVPIGHRHFYLPMIGLIMLLMKMLKPLRAGSAVIFLLAGLLSAPLASAQLHIWRGGKSIWKHVKENRGRREDWVYQAQMQMADEVQRSKGSLRRAAAIYWSLILGETSGPPYHFLNLYNVYLRMGKSKNSTRMDHMRFLFKNQYETEMSLDEFYDRVKQATDDSEEVEKIVQEVMQGKGSAKP